MIEVLNLYRSFNTKTALKNISFTAQKNEFIHLAGENGAGKSTLLKILSTALNPSRGQVIYNGVSLHKNQIKARQEIIYIPSEENIFFPRLTGLQNLVLLSRFFSISEKEVKNKLSELSAIFNIDEAMHTPFFNCSSGMKQKIKLAALYIRNGSIVLLDEPMRSLDKTSRSQVKNVIKLISRNAICIYTDHTGEDLSSLSTKTLSISKGMLV